tara:strand:- start:132 stop:599 length:468 start_codon:yes stop_codon:yes gene_type:complete
MSNTTSFQPYHHHELYLTFINVEELEKDIDECDENLRVHAYANLQYAKNILNGVYWGDPNGMEVCINKFKEYYLQKDKLTWIYAESNSRPVADYNEEAFRRVSEDMLDVIKWGESKIEYVKQVIMVCDMIIAEQPRKKPTRRGGKKHRKNKTNIN